MLDDDFLQDEAPAEEPDDVQEPADEPEPDEAPADTPSAPEADTIQTPSGDKAGDTSDTPDTDAPDDDFVFVTVDDPEDAQDDTLDDDAFSVAVYAEPYSFSEVYYFDNNVTDDTIGGFYTDAAHQNKIAFSESDGETITMQKFIESYCSASGAIIHLDSKYVLPSGSTETWKPQNSVTLMRTPVSTNDKNANNIDLHGMLTLGGNLTINVQTPSGKGASIVLQSGSYLTIENDVTIYGCNTDGGINGGCIYLYGGTLEMTGGTLTGAQVTGTGGAVHIESGATFTMSGGAITKNTCRNGGGVYVDSGATFTMSGGSIENNTASHNTSNGGGGGVYVNGGTVEMTGGFIEKNTADYGGGVYLNGSTSTFELSNGSISENTSTQNSGGGVFVHGGTFTISNGRISDNKCETANFTGGGGIYITGVDTTTATLTMTGGEISGNVSAGSGGGVFLSNATFNMSGGVISGNQNIFVAHGDANAWGGGVAMTGDFNQTTFTMTGGIITRNMSVSTSAVSVMGGTFYIQGGTITDNEWGSSNHNEVSVNQSGQIRISGGSVKHINTGNSGGRDFTTDADGKSVVRYPVQVGYSEGYSVEKREIHITTLDGKDVTNSLLNDYSFTDVYTDSEGKIYLWLPALENGKKYTITYGETPATVTYQAKIQRKVDGGYKDIGMSVEYGTELWAVLEAQDTSTQSYSLYSEDDLTTASEVESGKMYAWAYADSRTSDNWTTIADAEKQYYTPTVEQAGKWVRVTMKRNTNDTEEYTSEPVLIGEPRLSVTVPLSITVTIQPDTGEGIVQGDGDYIALYSADNGCSVWNDSDVTVILESVTFKWADDAEKYFTNFTAQKPTITLGTYSSQPSADGKTITWTPQWQIESGGSADLQWSFFLNGNAISQELQADTKATIGTITYTVSFADTDASGGAGSDSAASTRSSGTPVVFY